MQMNLMRVQIKTKNYDILRVKPTFENRKNRL